MEKLNEKVLDAWLRMSVSLNYEKLVTCLTYNETLILNYIYRSNKIGESITATDLCAKTNMLKSQMNRTLNSLEDKGIIIREKSESDKRVSYLKMDGYRLWEYMGDNTEIMKFIDAIIEKYGEERTLHVAKMINEISDIAEEVINE